MRKLLCIMLLFLAMSRASNTFAAPITGYGVSTTIPLDQRYQYYEAVGGGTTLEINFKADLGRSGGLGYVTNNTATAVYLHLNYLKDTSNTMEPIKVPAGATFEFYPTNMRLDSIQITSAAAIDVDVLIQ